MTLFYFNDLAPVIVSSIMFVFLSMLHKTILPDMYSSVLQFRAGANTKKQLAVL